MSDTLGRYHFLAWSRRGISGSLTNVDSGGSLPARASLSVQLNLTVGQNGAASPVTPTPMAVQMFGPGDVIGIDPRHIVRTEPRPFTSNFEPNYLVGIEFDSPDLPWMFTPAAPNGDRLRPWVALIALTADEITPPAAPNPLPTIGVKNIAVLPDLSDSWNWAHVQVSGDTSLSDSMVTAPGNVISRLLCPRRLDPETSYSAFLVPAFEIGRQAGLGQDVSAISNSDPAWTNSTTAPLTLPFYYRFDFHTSDAGDFESLVRRLTPRVLPASVGQRPLDVSQPASDIPSAGPPLGLDGAIQSISTTETPWNDPPKTAFQSAIQPWINDTNPTVDDPAHPAPDDPVVVPPIYGRWHAAVTSVDRTQPGWINTLNLDPRNRSAGGMGTQVVQEERTALMASAWQQVEGVLRANELLRQAQLARAALQMIHQQRLMPTQAETLITVTAPLHSRMLASPMTIAATVKASRLPQRMLSSTFRRVTTRPRFMAAAVAVKTPLLARVNSGDILVVPAPKPPDGMVSIEQISDRVSTGTLLARAARLAAVTPVTAAGPAEPKPPAVETVAAPTTAAETVAAATLASERSRIATGLRAVNFTSAALNEIPQYPNFQIVAPGVAAAAQAGGAGAKDSAQAAGFRTAVQDLFTAYQAAPVDPPSAQPLAISTLKSTVMTGLDPATTVPRRAQSLIRLSGAINWKPVDPIDPIMAAPDFPQAMYGPLRDLSPDYILPGVELIPPDTLGLLVTNHAFIESYMVGLNHEMARQLLWNDYPTDQRGSYFRQFWDVSAYVPQPGDPTDPAKLTELLKDIPPIHTWPRTSALGQHPNRTGIVPNNIVLLVRGELFKRYPNTIVYAGKAKKAGDGSRVLDETDERYPIFRGTLPDDITFLGFNLSIPDARGGTTQSPEGFFFVFQQQPSEPRFGLEPTADANPVTHWSDLAWTNFASGGVAPNVTPARLAQADKNSVIRNSPWRLASQMVSMVASAVTLPDFLRPAVSPHATAIANDAENPNDTNNNWGVNSAQTAYILLRLPFRILIHADLMLPGSS